MDIFYVSEDALTLVPVMTARSFLLIWSTFTAAKGKFSANL